MAGKEATVYIVDVGSTMKEYGAGRQETNFDWAMRYFWDRIGTTVSTGRKTLLSAVIAVRSDKTTNDLSDDDHYQNINVLRDLGQVLMPDIRSLKENLVAGDQENGDLFSALALAMGLIIKTCKALQYDRKIVILTDARSPMITNGLSDICKKLQEDKIHLLILGVDFDDPAAGFKEEAKDPIKAENEIILKQFCQDCGGAFATLQQTIDELETPRLKQTRPIASYKGFLTLGGSADLNGQVQQAQESKPRMDINIVRYTKVMVAKPPTASSHVIRSDLGGHIAEHHPADSSADPLVATKHARTYQVDDPDAPGGKREVESDGLARGYTYGQTVVHISETDQGVTDFKSMQGLQVLGFVDASKYERFFEMGRASIIIGEPTNEKACIALSSFIHALYELEVYAVARLVPKPDKDPQVVLLSPGIEPDLECLYEVDLPFAEDIRSYRFPPLDRIITVSGQEVTAHRNLPSKELQQAMDAYVDSMDLSEAAADDDGKATEYLTIDSSYNPVLHHLNTVIKQRAIDPSGPVPSPVSILTQFQHPPEQLREHSSAEREHLIRQSDVKTVPPKALRKRYHRKEERPLSDLNVNDLLQQRKELKKIDPDNAIPEFKQIVMDLGQEEDVKAVVDQMQTILQDWISHSVGDSGYSRALEALSVLRDELIDLEMPMLFNTVLRNLKQKLAANELGGDRQEMWFRLRRAQFSLVSKDEEQHSDVTAEEAQSFLTAKLHD